MPQRTLLDVLMQRDGLTKEEALSVIHEARLCVLQGEDPEEILREYFYLEPDYAFDLLSF